jgi:hypothetical protein
LCDSWRVVQEKIVTTETLEVDEQFNSETQYIRGGYVAALYDANWYLGKIVDTDEDNSGLDYEVSFMTQRKSMFNGRKKKTQFGVNGKIFFVKSVPLLQAGSLKECTSYRIMTLKQFKKV